MKVLYLTNLPSPYRVRFFSELGKLCDLTVLYERHSAGDRNTKWNVQAEGTFKEIYLEGKEISSDNSFCPSVMKYLNKKYDQIVVGMYSTYTAMISIAYMKLRNIPFTISTDGGFVTSEKKFKFLLKKTLIGAADAWLSTGSMASSYLMYYGAKENEIYCYPFTSVSKDDILKAPINNERKCLLRNKLGIDYDKVIVSVGQFTYRKGFDVLVKAAEKFDNSVGLYIIGGTKSDMETLLERKIPENVHTIDFLTKQELFEYYKVADVFVLPTREDVWGLVINEAMACGLPIVTTNCCASGLELVLNGENGFIVPAEDSDQLAVRIKEVLVDNTVSYTQNSLMRIQKYTYSTMAEEHMKIFGQILEKRGKRQ